MIRRTTIDGRHARPTTDPIFLGSVEIQEIVNETAAELLRVTAVTFVDGAANRPHQHSTDQVLIAVSGVGFIASDVEALELEPGDAAFIPSGTRHWHGAAPGQTFTHLSILTPGHTEVVADEIIIAP
jgi:quercetin dioxygenase-like cupin family protein